MSGTVEYFKGKNNQFYFNVKAANGEVVATSEGYSSLRDARRGWAAVKTAALTAAAADPIPAPTQEWEDDLLGKPPES